jgi:hypothetical protein
MDKVLKDLRVTSEDVLCIDEELKRVFPPFITQMWNTIGERTKYEPGLLGPNPNRNGAFKVFASEILFLEYIRIVYHPETINMLYIGAAPGIDKHALLELYPELTIWAYDPVPHACTHPRYHANQVAFTDKWAEKWRRWRVSRPDEFFFFYSDLRTQGEDAAQTTNNAPSDLLLSLRWAETVNASLSSHKFSFDYTDGITSVPQGYMVPQSHGGQSSTECRYWVPCTSYEHDVPLIDVSHRWHEEVMFNWNLHHRHPASPDGYDFTLMSWLVGRFNIRIPTFVPAPKRPMRHGVTKQNADLIPTPPAKPRIHLVNNKSTPLLPTPKVSQPGSIQVTPVSSPQKRNWKVAVTTPSPKQQQVRDSKHSPGQFKSAPKASVPQFKMGPAVKTLRGGV